MQTQVEKRETELPVREKQATRDVGTYEGSYFEPSVDIYETDDALVVSADLPGVEASDVQTDLRDNLLTLTAKLGPLESNWKPLWREYQEGHYLRQFRVSHHIDQSKIEAQLKDGVLTLTLPKADSVKPRKIQIRSE